MSGFLAVVDADGRWSTDADIARILTALAPRGDRCETWRGLDATLVATRFEWELAPGFAGGALIIHDGDVTVAADATLYYRNDLERKLRGAGVRPHGASAGHLIAAAYRAWGTRCPLHLEGDFAFVVHDRAQHRTFAARDFMGRRPLYYAEVDTCLVIASSVAAILAHPACPRDLDEVALGELVAVSLSGHDRTPYAAVRALPAATSLTRDGLSGVRRDAYWRLALSSDADTQSFDAATEQLSELLSSAILERCAAEGPTTLWLSGGYDSPVLYGVGNAALDKRGLDRLSTVSFSYPEGDPAREDELITEIVRFWGAEPTWLSIDEVPLLDNAAAHAARADVPFQHAFENWLRALLRATKRQGARVALYGDGGDQLFAVSTIFLRDLFAGMHWRELRREWRAFGGGGARALWHSVARPVLAGQAQARRGPRRPEIAFPAWLRPDFVRRHRLEARQLEAEAALAAEGGGRAGAETRRSLANPTTQRVLTGFSALGLEHSVELRAPLLDRRIVEFAAARPRSERASDGAVKHLLRRTARDLLPPSILAPRTHKTGVLTGYFARSFRADPGDVVSDAFAASMLAELGIVDGAVMQQSWREYQAGRGGGGGHLFVAFQLELWLKARHLTPVVSTETRSEWIRMPAAGFVQ